MDALELAAGGVSGYLIGIEQHGQHLTIRQGNENGTRAAKQVVSIAKPRIAMCQNWNSDDGSG